MAIKHVILANGSRLLREMLHHVINKSEELEVIQEIQNQEDLSSAIQRFEPAWVVVSSQTGEHARRWLNTCVAQHPSVRFIVLSSDNSRINIRSQATFEEDLTNLSLNDFIHVLEGNLQHT